MNNLGLLYHNIGNLTKAEEFHLKSLKIYQKLFDENQFPVTSSMNNLECLYQNMGAFTEG